MSGSAAAALVEFRKLDFSSVRGNKMKKRSESARRQRTVEVVVAEGGEAMATRWRGITDIIIFNTFSFACRL